MPKSLPELADEYRRELLDQIVPFWEQYSLDRVHGGYFTCLRPDGRVFDTDKFVWLQARQVWTFATLHRRIDAGRGWLEVARHGADFLERYGRAPMGGWYFSLTQAGEPLVVPYNIFSDCFAAQAFGQLYQATGEERYGILARETFTAILARRDNPKGQWSKAIAGTRPLKNFALPMILCNLALEIEPLLKPELVQRLTEECLHEVMTVFLDEDTGLLLENVHPDGSLTDCFEGRLLNPGHAIEAMWFVMDLAERRGDTKLLHRAKDLTLRTLEYGWDEKHGGVFYFLDRLGQPPQQLEWDQKLWWVHLETLIALLKGYRHTDDARCLEWFHRVHDYTWKHFRDSEQGGEWYGYLNRRGEVLLDLKGGKWKGCYHVPRALVQCWWELDELGGRR